MRGAPSARGASGLRGRFKEALGRGRAGAASPAAVGPAGRGAASSAAPVWRRRPEGRSRAGAGTRGEWSQPPGREGEGARPGALFRAGGVAAPPPRALQRSARAECAPGLAGSGLLPPPQAPAERCAIEKSATIETPAGRACPPPKEPLSWNRPSVSCLPRRGQAGRWAAGLERRGRWGGLFLPF